MNVRRSATQTAPTYKPQFLVVVHDDASLDRLPADAAEVRRIHGRLLVALAQPRAGFTTDAAVARSAAHSANEALTQREGDVQRLLRGTGVDWATVRMPFRNSRSATRRERRLASAASRASRRHGASPLPPPSTAGEDAIRPEPLAGSLGQP